MGSESKFNVTNFVFKGGNVSSNQFYGQNVWLQESAQVTLANRGALNHNLYIDGKSTFSTTPNEAILSGGKKLSIGGESSFSIASGNGTLGVNESGDTIIQTEIGSKLEISKLLAQGGSKVYVSLDLDKVEKDSSAQKPASQQKNFSIEAQNGSSVYVNSWDMNRQSFANGETSLTTNAAVQNPLWDTKARYGTDKLHRPAHQGKSLYLPAPKPRECRQTHSECWE